MTADRSPPTAAAEIQRGERFSFGRNWTSFLKTIDEQRIAIATQSLADLLQVQTLAGQSFLDVGCGSGLFSLAARRLGAKVQSFDFDAQSVACCEELRRRFLADDPDWRIETGSALDDGYLRSLGTFDVVYSWGVLHHTGDMWRALANVSDCVRPDGQLAIAIYNDQGWRSRCWHRVKQIYCSGPVGRGAMMALFFPWFFLRTILVSCLRGKNEFAAYRQRRGMSIVHDWIDWLGGLPFEVASFEAIESFYRERGFVLRNSRRTRRLGCNEFCFQKLPADQ